MPDREPGPHGSGGGDGGTSVVAELITSVTGVDWTREPDVPVTVRGKVPVEAPVDIVKVDVPIPLITVGLNAAVVPGGKPLMLSFTLPINPPKSAVETVKLALEPAVTDCDAGVGEIEKSPTGTTGR